MTNHFPDNKYVQRIGGHICLHLHEGEGSSSVEHVR
jgi:hypothetical protein